jgi:hypothetical protein
LSANRATGQAILADRPARLRQDDVDSPLAGRLRDLRLAGSSTPEFREQGQRVGFEAAGLPGQRAVLRV